MKVYDSWTNKEIDVDLLVRRYPNDNLGLQLISLEGPYATLTVNIGKVSENHAYLDVNNFPEGPTFVTSNDLGSPTDSHGSSGYCTYPLFKLNIDKIKQVCINHDDLEEWLS